VDLDALGEPDPRLRRIRAYLELHIEQGPVLERAGAPVGAVTGTIGIERDRLAFDGQSAHAGPTPMDERHDALLAAAESALAVERLAIAAGGRATCGRLDVSPGVPTAVNGRAELYVDLRHDDAGTLARMRADVLSEASAIAQARGCSVQREHVWGIEPRPFDARLVAAAVEACVAVGARGLTLPSGALHDAAELAAAVPTAMIFCASLRGLSHSPEEDSRPADLASSIKAFEHLTRTALGA
jgi:N-carbamoyl-L-amino-acid hydrolase